MQPAPSRFRRPPRRARWLLGGASFVLGVALLVLLARGNTPHGLGAAAAAAVGATSGGAAAAAAVDQRPQLEQQQAQQQDQEKPQQRQQAAESKHTGIFYENKLQDGQVVMEEVLDEPVPEDCHMEPSADYDGPALSWGLEYKLPSAARCCQACKDVAPSPEGHPCMMWVWCGDPSGMCWAPDIWNHTTGECWLKFQPEWDRNPDLKATNLVVNARGPYPPEFRAYHTTAPEVVAWTAGLVVPKS